MHSFKNILTHYVKTLQPKSIIEWGPGESTKIILENAPTDAKITSVENAEKYYEMYKHLTSDTRLNLVKSAMSCAVSEYAYIATTLPPIDLAFVDGRRRVECCFAALANLSPNGVVILHDMRREQYTKILFPFIRVLDCKDDTLVFTLCNSLRR